MDVVGCLFVGGEGVAATSLMNVGSCSSSGACIQRRYSSGSVAELARGIFDNGAWWRGGVDVYCFAAMRGDLRAGGRSTVVEYGVSAALM